MTAVSVEDAVDAAGSEDDREGTDTSKKSPRSQAGYEAVYWAHIESDHPQTFSNFVEFAKAKESYYNWKSSECSRMTLTTATSGSDSRSRH